MAKEISKSWKVMVNNVDLSTWGFHVTIADSKEKVEVSGFSATGAREYLPGLAEQTVTVEFVNDRAVGGPHATVYPLYTGGSAFKFYVMPHSELGTSATNPLYGGSASVYTFPSEATLNEREEISLEFSPAPGSSFAWGTVAP